MVLEGGEEVLAPIVVTAVHPKITFLEQIERYELPDDVRPRHRELADAQRHGEDQPGALGAADVRRRPRLRPADPRRRDPGARRPRVPRDRVPGGACGQGRDPAVQRHGDPDGVRPDARARGDPRDVVFTQWVPAGWADEDGHDEELEAYADRLVDRIDAVAPGFKGSVLHRQVIGPKQMQDDWGLIGGNIFHGELTVDQLFHMRPAPGYADYRTPIRGLYQASSATHAGGGVTGLPGHHCVREILRDKGKRKALVYRSGAPRRAPAWASAPVGLVRPGRGAATSTPRSPRRSRSGRRTRPGRRGSARRRRPQPARSGRRPPTPCSAAPRRPRPRIAPPRSARPERVRERDQHAGRRPPIARKASVARVDVLSAASAIPAAIASVQTADRRIVA